MKKTVRVLQILGILQRGGAETMVMNLYRSIDRNKVQFDFVVHVETPGAYDSEVESLGGNLFYAPRYRGINHFEYISWWKDFFEKHPEHEIVHSHIRSTASIIIPIAKSYGKITIAHSHSTSEGRGIAAGIKRLYEIKIRRVADFLFACSEGAGRWLFGSKAITRDNFFVLKNAINLDSFSYNAKKRMQIREELGVDDFFVIGTVGSITGPKNPLGMVEIIEAVCEKVPETRFLWIGTGDMEFEIKELVADSGIRDNVIFLGIRSDIPNVLSGLDVFVLPSIWEGLPLAVIEAQASGVPCVISDTISEEVCVTPCVQRVALGDTQRWVSSILSARDSTDRTKVIENIKAAGYDINTTAQWLQEFYLRQTYI